MKYVRVCSDHFVKGGHKFMANVFLFGYKYFEAGSSWLIKMANATDLKDFSQITASAV